MKVPRFAASAIVLVGFLLSCGGGGGSRPTQSGTGLLQASGKVTLPAGFKDSVSSLFVSSGFDQEPVSANGSFKLMVAGPGETEVDLVDASGDILMTGFADGGSTGSPEAGGNGQVSATTTANAMIFFGLGGYTLPPSLWVQLRSYTAQTSQISSATTTVAARLAANPLAIAANDSQIDAAIKTAVTGISAGHTVAPSESVRPQVISVSVTKKGISFRDTGTDTLVQPGAEQSGVEIQNNPDGSGIQFVNHFRRRAAAFIYETSVTLSGDTTNTNLTSLIPLGSPLLGSTTGEFATALNLGIDPSHFIEIQPANGLHGTFGSIVDRLFGNGAMTPVTTGPIDLPLAPGTSRTNYTIVVLGPSWGNLNSLTAFDAGFDSRFTSYESFWSHAVGLMSLEEMLLDILMPMVASVDLPEFEIGSLDAEDVQEIVNALSNVPDLISSMEQGQWTSSANSVIQNAADSAAVRDALLKAMLDANLPSKAVANALKQGEAKVERFFKVVALVDLLLQTVDSSAVVYTSTAFDTGDAWLGNVVQKAVRLTPSTATLTASQQSATFTVTPANGTNPDKPFYFHYTVTGAAAGAIEDTTHNSGKDTDFFSQDDSVTFVPNLLAADNSTATVSVTAFLNIGTATKPVAGDEVGTASSVITDKIDEVGPCGSVPQTLTGGLNVTVSPTVIQPGGTITITVSGYTGTPQVEVGVNANWFLHSYAVSGGSSHTWPDNDPLEGGTPFTLPTAGTPSTATITCTIDKITPDQCPSLFEGKTGPGDLSGIWVVGFGPKGFTAVPIQVQGTPDSP